MLPFSPSTERKISVGVLMKHLTSSFHMPKRPPVHIVANASAAMLEQANIFFIMMCPS